MPHHGKTTVISETDFANVKKVMFREREQAVVPVFNPDLTRGNVKDVGMCGQVVTVGIKGNLDDGGNLFVVVEGEPLDEVVAFISVSKTYCLVSVTISYLLRVIIELIRHVI